MHLQNANAKFDDFDEKTCFFHENVYLRQIKSAYFLAAILGNLRQNIGQKAQTGFWKTVKNSHFLELFCVKSPFRDFVRLLPLIWYGISKEAFFDEKERKLMKNEWFFEPFLWDFAHKPRIHLFRYFSTFDLRHYRLYVWKPCVFVCFHAFYVYFGRLGLISDPGLELEGGL